MKTFLIFKSGLNPNFRYTSKEVQSEPLQIRGNVRCIKSENNPSDSEMATYFNVAHSYTVEEWIESQGYSAIRLLTVRELEGKLLAAGKVSAKISAIRQWADGLIASFALNPEPRNDWPEAPFAFDEVVQEAVSTLA
jgi:hypothetical protein